MYQCVLVYIEFGRACRDSILCVVESAQGSEITKMVIARLPLTKQASIQLHEFDRNLATGLRLLYAGNMFGHWL